ncbi:protein-disulfide reductase DsbD N-terminal domain-containing protein [Mucilaginibacter myungsuensis]|uniref:Protein-disulfide reductase DsbD N-terminal domain-containing protein n=1 Tax=Mucilaginibacter myungsuensis TaxID=649104 RepID=A0A929PVB7_9SPHI|nr:protein-disulfide reductase DsbD N-terminal domain-containing protein [Mucilaginibacter myungsuensis]MBE9661623.1 protein-disulfide reductase DsbD N-terminal domain-containing protein [Mucilaginibacter myungsuensis]MDN3597767.1 protein-disulfide reductase DsbD N-terminal domain-containing protein [Mucilaginibacter myungsuensis]
MKKLLFVLVLMLAGRGAFAQIESHVTWAYAAKKVSATEAVVLIKATIDDEWHVYSQTVKDGGPIKTSFKFTPSKEFTPVGKTTEPKPITKYEKNFGMDVSYFENSVVFQQKVKLKGKKATVKGSLEYMTCNDQKCLPPETVEFSVNVAL